MILPANRAKFSENMPYNAVGIDFNLVGVIYLGGYGIAINFIEINLL